MLRVITARATWAMVLPVLKACAWMRGERGFREQMLLGHRKPVAC
jgi:hypothetical protein